MQAAAGVIQSLGRSVANLSTLQLMQLLTSCTHFTSKRIQSGDLSRWSGYYADVVIALRMDVSGGHKDDADVSGDGRVTQLMYA